MNAGAIELRLCESVGEVSAAEWDALGAEAHPFVSHAWLKAMEVSGAVGEGTGWGAFALTARNASGKLIGAMPLYTKVHSYGEYVYDWAWADLAQRIGVSYYPKLVSTSPFSPVSGPRLLLAPELDEVTRGRVFDAMVSTTIELARDNELCGVHFLFLDSEAAERMAGLGLLTRRAHQYHWKNDGYADFDDFLSRFRSKRRREIRRERRRLAERGIRVDAVDGTDASEADMDAVFGFYSDTCRKHMWGQRYLNRAFFREVHETMPERVVLMLARDAAGDTIAGTFNVVSDDRWYGRYWGADVEVPFLHFETCYYATIEEAIRRGVTCIEPGAGGDHKYVRGFDPVTTYSAHWLADEGLSALLSRATAQESEYVDETVEHLAARSPLRKAPDEA